MSITVTIANTPAQAAIGGDSVSVQIGSGGTTATISGGVAGPAGADGAPGANGAGINVIEFSWGDATPKSLLTVAAGKSIFSCRINIDIAFDGTAPSLTVGPAGDPDELMPAGGNDPATVGQYEYSPGIVYGASTALLLTIVPGAGASAGRGQVILEIEP